MNTQQPVKTFPQRDTHQHKWYPVTRNCDSSIKPHLYIFPQLSAFSDRKKQMTKREAQQLDLDETIYAEMARESGADFTRQTKVRFNLSGIQEQQPPVKFTITMNKQRPTTSNQPPTAGNQRPLSKNKKRRLRRKKAKKTSNSQTTSAPEQAHTQLRAAHTAPQIIIHFGK